MCAAQHLPYSNRIIVCHFFAVQHFVIRHVVRQKYKLTFSWPFASPIDWKGLLCVMFLPDENALSVVSKHKKLDLFVTRCLFLSLNRVLFIPQNEFVLVNIYGGEVRDQNQSFDVISASPFLLLPIIASGSSFINAFETIYRVLDHLMFNW